ncbi:tyrosine-protein kinase Wzc [Nonlabens ulvanivorans]|nr:hypothetical protein [Nonlabens ulvanivorans]GAK89375.1 tyrosine-protein kinase Wzc [Nonlabens ulvanivorans]
MGGTVNRYKGISIRQQPDGSSILLLSMSGGNKQRLIDYINTSSVILERGELQRKNKFAVSTIKYIDSSLVVQVAALKKSEQDLEDFRDKSQILDATVQNTDYNQKLTEFEIQKRGIQNKLNYYDNLNQYLQNRTDYTVIQAPISSRYRRRKHSCCSRSINIFIRRTQKKRVCDESRRSSFSTNRSRY